MEAGGYAANGGRYAHYYRLVWRVHADSSALTTTNLGTLAADLHSARCHTAGPVGVSGFRLGSHCGATSWASCMAGASRRVAPRSC